MKLSSAYLHCKNAIASQVPVMLWGPPGIGKSSIIHQISNELGMNMVDLRLAQLEPTDLRGVPMPNRETMRAEWFLPAFWPHRAKEDGERTVTVVTINKDGEEEEKEQVIKYKAGQCPSGPGVIFLDEIEKAPVSVKNASLQLVLDRRIGDYILPDDWAIVCAGNREEDGCFSAPLGKALENRMIHFEVDANVDDWAAWARNNNIVEDIIGFLYFRSDLLYHQTDDHAFPTPRSWEMGSTLLKTAKGVRERKELLQATVGTGAAQEFTVWQSVYKNVDPEAVFKGEMPNFDGQDQSFRYAVALAVAFHLRKRKNGIKKAEQHIAKFLGMLTAELRVVFLRQQTLPCLESMMKHSEFKPMVKEMMKVVV
jgi:hypothetical protein